jgi:hypothetical protein
VQRGIWVMLFGETVAVYCENHTQIYCVPSPYPIECQVSHDMGRVMVDKLKGGVLSSYYRSS